jgi:hypothetical protein
MQWNIYVFQEFKIMAAGFYGKGRGEKYVISPACCCCCCCCCVFSEEEEGGERTLCLFCKQQEDTGIWLAAARGTREFLSVDDAKVEEARINRNAH